MSYVFMAHCLRKVRGLIDVNNSKQIMKFGFDTGELFQGVSGSYLGQPLAASHINISISDQISVISF